MVVLDAVLGAAKDLFREWKRSSGKRTASAAAAAAGTGVASTAAASAAPAASARRVGVPAFRVPPANADVYETRPPKKHRRSKKHSPHDKKKNGRKA